MVARSGINIPHYIPGNASARGAPVDDHLEACKTSEMVLCLAQLA